MSGGVRSQACRAATSSTRRGRTPSTRRDARWSQWTSGPTGSTSTPRRSTSSPMWCPAARCDCTNTISPIRVSALNSPYPRILAPYHDFSILVIWNPWIDRSREMSDFGDDEFPNMLCVEAGNVTSPVILLPGTAFEASQILQVEQSVLE